MPAESPPDRTALRRTMRAVRRSIAPDVAATNASAAAERAMDLLGRYGLLSGDVPLSVGATIADDGELDPRPLVAALVARDARVAFARVADGVMGFALLGPSETLVTGPGAVFQPPTDAVAIAPGELDVVLVPIVAFDVRCERIGRGAGHYDRTFADRVATSPLLIGLGHDEQRVADVWPEAHDVALDHVVTPTAVFSRRGSRDHRSR